MIKHKVIVESLNKRYFSKVIVSLILLPINFIINAIIPRSLGPLFYGKFNFLVLSFTQISEFFESGFGMAYYNKLSQNLKDKGIVRFFLGSRIIFSLIIILFCSITFLFNLEQIIWPDQEKKYIIMALALSIFYIFSSTSKTTIDAFGFTFSGEFVDLFIKLFGFLLILGFYIYSELNMTIYFIYNYLIQFLLIFGWTIILFKGGVNYFKIPALTYKEIRKYILDFWQYSNPLIVLAIITSLTSFCDIWFLQKFGGSIEQGFYALAFKLSALAFLFAKPMNALIMREFSVAFGKNDIKKIKKIFYDYIPSLYLITAFFAIFIFTQAENITVLYAGENFKGAAIVLCLMSFYPIHQTYGQMSGAVFLASNQTKLYRNISVLTRIFGLILSFFLIAPEKFYGLNLGASGLAIKMLIYQYILVNIQLYYNSKYLSLSFKKLFVHQIQVISILLLLSIIVKKITTLFYFNGIMLILFSGIVYTVLTFFIVNYFPNSLGLYKTDISKYKKLIILNLKSITLKK